MTTSSENIAISRRTVRQVITIVISVLILFAIAILIITVARSLQQPDPLSGAINTNEYQAVFLANGEVYFGRMTSGPGGQFYYLRHVYFLQTTAKNGKTTSRNLVKLTSQIQGPEDFIAINRSQISYVENLKPGGQAARLMSSSP